VSDRFDELVGEVADPGERERLRRVHELLLSVEPPPDLATAPPPAAAPVAVLPSRPRGRVLALLAAAIAVVAFGAGWLGGARSDDGGPERVIVMSGVGEASGATASIELLPADEAGNWPMNVLVRGLEPSRDRTDFYELWLTKDGKPSDSCGRFVVGSGQTTVVLSVPYGLRRYDGWVVTRAGSDEILLTTA
jgi:hypothetical protein